MGFAKNPAAVFLEVTLLEVEALNVSYDREVILRDISLSVEAGTIVGLIGPNGAGKTSLIRAISGILPVQSGVVRLNDIDLCRLSTIERARLIAVVPQASHLPTGFTGWETVILGRTPHLSWLGMLSEQDREIASQAMQLTQTEALAERIVTEISGGEQQRLLLARALTQSAPLLLMDEPTAHLDLQFQVHLLELIRKLVNEKNLAVLIAMHDLNLISRYVDKTAVLVNGELLAFGKNEDVLREDILSQAYQLPLKVFPVGGNGQKVITPFG
jgi:ABC-type cobalamin/Fe3+-siderophores transport system ATPase subunit